MRYMLRFWQELLALLRAKFFDRPLSAEQCRAILNWVSAQNLAPGDRRELEVPGGVGGLKGQTAVHALRTGDGRYCVLWKSMIGWKGNFEGTLCCDQPLRPGEIVEARDQRTYISFGGVSPWDELYLRKRVDDCRFQVYFDLN